jgi:hypothetical protein
MDDARSSPDARRAAFHEAGHVVVACALGLEVRWARLLPETEDAAGEVNRQTADHLPPEDQIAVLMAGYWGAKMSGVPQVNPAEFDTDEIQTLNVMLRNYPEDDLAQEELRSRGIARAQELTMRHAQSIILIAEELERRGEILADDVARLLSSSELAHRSR